METINEQTIWAPPIISHQEIALKFLNEKVRSFVPIYNTVLRKGNGDVLQTCFMVKVVKGEFVTEDHVKDFCDMINKAEEAGLIEYGALSPVSSMELVLKDEDGVSKHLLMYYPATKYQTEELKKHNSIFVEEGEFPKDN